MKEAFKKAFIPSCIFALLGIPFAIIGAVFFFILGLIIFTLGFYVYGKIVRKKILSEDETIEMCKLYMDKFTNKMDFLTPLKLGYFRLTSTLYDENNNTLIYRLEYNKDYDINSVVEEYRMAVEGLLEKNDLEESKQYIACVYIGADFVAQIKNTKNGKCGEMRLTNEEMKSILSKWHIFGTEYSWL